jgi:hypothetical protein
MRRFGLFQIASDAMVDSIVASDKYEAQEIFCIRKNLDLHNLTIIFYIKEIE